MLFTDSDIITSGDLDAIDSEASTAANVAKPAISLDGSGSICEQAWVEVGRHILRATQMYTSYLTQPGMSGGHVAAVLNTGVPARTQPRTRLNQIVAHEANYASCYSRIQRWMQYHALAMLFRDASSRMGKDRFEEKMTRYAAAAQSEWMGLRSEGLPYIWNPLEAPGAKHGFNAGSWSTANLSQVAGTAAGGTFYVAITYYDGSRYVSQSSNGNAESAPSSYQQAVVDANNVLKVDISSLNPPNGQQDPVGLSQGTWTPLNATHWNLWVGTSPSGPLYLQREGIPIGTKTWTLPGDPVLSGSTVGNGQWPDLNMVFQNVVMRG